MASPGYGDNGSVIGPANTPTSSAASGVWSLGELAEAERDSIWPAPDAITKFGLLTLPVSSHYPSTFRTIIDCDTSGNPVVLIPNGSTGNNYIVEINKSTWAFTYMRDYTLTGTGNIQLDQMGINPSDNSMIIIGTSNNGTGGMVVPNIGYLVKTGSTGWDDFQRYGTSNDGYFQGSMGGWPYSYQNYTEGGRIAFKPAAGSPSSSDDLYFSAGGRWTSSSQYFTRFGVYYNDNASAPTINGYLFQNDPSSLNSRGMGTCGMVGTSSAVCLGMSTYWNQPVLIGYTVSGTGSNNNYGNAPQGGVMSNFGVNLKTRLGPESHNGSQRVSGGNNHVVICGESGGDLHTARVEVNAPPSMQWNRKITPSTFGSSAYPTNTGGIVSTDGTKCYEAWASANSDGTNRGWMIIACRNFSTGAIVWQNRLTWADASEGTNTNFQGGDMKLGTTDSTDDTLYLVPVMYQTTSPSYINKVPIIRLRSDGGGQGTFNFSETGAAGGAISFTYATDTSPEASHSSTVNSYTSWYNPGALFGWTGSQTSTQAAITSGYSWSTS